LQARRTAQNVAHGIRRYNAGSPDDFPEIIAVSRSALWTNENLAEGRLQTGKVQNLRCAVRRLNATVVPAGDIFSFWKQVGQATRRRGYVEGRSLREGCLIPAIGGGLCQLSNALYDASIQSEFETIERWGHSQIIPGSQAALGRDATVAWNYIDLRFRAPHDFLIEARLTRDELSVRFRAREPRTAGHTPAAQSKTVSVEPPDNSLLPLSSLLAPRPMLNPAAHSCVSCGETACFRHRVPQPVNSNQTFWALDEYWPEFQFYLNEIIGIDDIAAIPINGARFKLPRYAWNTNISPHRVAAPLPTLARAVVARFHAGNAAALRQSQLDFSSYIARRYTRALPYEVTHVVVTQSLLPFFWQSGELGGRTFDVLMTRLPMATLHTKLNAAFAARPERSTLNDFRAPQALVEAEAEALAAASSIISPHSEIAALFPDKIHQLKWAATSTKIPGSPAQQSRKILFPGPSVARKGAYEVRTVAQELDLEVLIMGGQLEGNDFWNGVRVLRVERNAIPWSEILCVVQPSLNEDTPRALLSALARGVPVVSTSGCGIPPQHNLYLVPFCDESALRNAIQQLLSAQQRTKSESFVPVLKR
jgi:hypothetical protein